MAVGYHSGGISIWNIHNDTLLDYLSVHYMMAKSSIYNKQNEKLISAGFDSFINIIDINSRKLI